MRRGKGERRKREEGGEAKTDRSEQMSVSGEKQIKCCGLALCSLVLPVIMLRAWKGTLSKLATCAGGAGVAGVTDAEEVEARDIEAEEVVAKLAEEGAADTEEGAEALGSVESRRAASC